MKVLKWPGPEEKRSKRPYRDTALVYAGFAALIVILAFVTGGEMKRAVVVALATYLVATGWTWFRLYRRKSRKEPE